MGFKTFLKLVVLFTLTVPAWSKDLPKSETQAPEAFPELDFEAATVKAEIERSRSRVRLFSVGERKKLASGRATKAIGLTKDLYQKTVDPKLKYKLSLKLAKLYFDQSQLQMVIDEEAYESKLKNYLSSGPPKGSKPPKPPDHKKSRVYEDQAVGVLAQFVNTPGQREIDESLYFLGMIYANRGEFEKARPYYQRILTDYPQSEYRWESKLMVAEGYFDDAQFQSALKLYNEVIQERAEHPYPRYKKAWTLFNLKRFDACIELFLALFREGRSPTASAPQIEISKQIIGDMVLIYTDALKIKEGIQFYDGIAPDPASYTKLHKMAKALNENGLYKQSREVSQHLFKTYAAAPIIPLVIATYLDTFKSDVHNIKKFHRTLVSELKQKLRQYPPLQRAQKDTKMIETYLELERFVVKHAKKLHSDAQDFLKKVKVGKSKDKRAMSSAQVRYESALLYYDVYDMYFTPWPYSKFGLEMAFYHGELEFERKNYEKAAGAYVLALRLRNKAKTKREKKFIDEAMYGAVVSYDKLVGTQEKKQAKAKGEDLSQPKPLSSIASKFLQAASLFLQNMPKHKAYDQILYRTAKVYVDHNLFQQAVPIFWKVIQKDPKHRLSRLSADLILDAYNALKDYPGLIQAGGQLLAIPALATPQFKLETKKLMDQAQFKTVETIEAKQDFAAAAQAYMNLSTDNKSSSLGEMSLNNAAVNFIKANQWPNAIQAYSGLIKRFPKSKFRKDALLTSAEYHQLMGNFVESQKLYKKFVKAYPEKSQQLIDVNYQIAFVAQTLGQNKIALDYYKSYLKLNSKAKDRNDVIERMCQCAARMDTKSLAVIRQAFGNKVRKQTQVICAFEHIKLNLKNKMPIGKLLQSHKKSFKKYIPVHERDVIAPFFIRKVTNLKEKYASKKLISVSAEQSGPLLQNKLKLLNQMDALVQEIADFGVVSAVFEASKTLSLTYIDLSDDILGAPLPKELSPSDTEIYKAQISKIANPLREKGLQGMKTLLESAGELQVADASLSSIWRQYDALTLQFNQMPTWLNELELMPFYLPTYKGQVRLKSYFDPISFEQFELARGGMALPNLSNLDEKTKAYYEVLSLCARGDYNQAWASIIPVLSQDPKNPFLLNLLAYLKLKLNVPQEGLLVLQLAQKMTSENNKHADLKDILILNEALLYLHHGEAAKGISLLGNLHEKNVIAGLLIGYYALKTYNFYWARAAFYQVVSGSKQDEDESWLSLGAGIAKWGTFDSVGALKSLKHVTGSSYRPINLAALPIAAALLLTDGNNKEKDQAKHFLSDYRSLNDQHRKRREWVNQLKLKD